MSPPCMPTPDHALAPYANWQPADRRRGRQPLARSARPRSCCEAHAALPCHARPQTRMGACARPLLHRRHTGPRPRLLLEFQPSAPTPGGEFSAALWLGEDFIPEAQTAIQAARAVSLQHITRFRDVDLMARARLGVAPLLRLGLAAPGGHLLALERGTTRVQLRARRFNRYLEQEGLHDALAERKLSGERWRRGTERYQRYLKAYRR